MKFEVRNLTDVATIKNGKKPKEKLPTGKFIIFGSNGEIGYSNETNVSRNTIIVGRVGANCGSVNFTEEDSWVSDNAISITANENTDPYYLYYLLSTKRINEYSTGSAQPLINQTILNSIPLSFPELNIQQTISKFLKSIDDKLKTNENIIYNLEELAQTLFKRWFVDFEFPNEDGKPYKSSGGKMVESELGVIPEGWEVKSIGEIAYVKGGKRLPKGEMVMETHTPYPY